jgi:Putative Ig domain
MRSLTAMGTMSSRKIGQIPVATAIALLSVALMTGCGYDSRGTTTTLSSDHSNMSSTMGEPVTFTAAVQGGGPLDMGEVDFLIDGKLYASHDLTLDEFGTGSVSAPAISTMAVGVHTVEAVYKADLSAGILGSSDTKQFTVNSTVALTITTTSPLPNGAVNQNPLYSQTFQPSGGVTPYTWSLASGTVPPGLALSSDGVLSGTPSLAGAYNFTVQVTDSSSPVLTATKSFSLQIDAGTLAITTTSLPSATVNQAYSQALQAAGGITPYNWSLSSGTLPAGLMLSAGGTISGAPKSSGTSNFTVQVKDSSSPIQTASQPLALTVQPGGNLVPTITQIVPEIVPPGSPDTQLEINGTNFDANASSVNFGPTGLATNSITPTKILATIPASLLVAPAGVNVSVTNVPPGGGTSNAVEFTISPGFKNGSPILNPGNIPAIDDAGDVVVAANGANAYVYVFNSSNNQWTLATVLTDPDVNPVAPLRGAVSVAINGNGNVIVLGSCADDSCLGHAFVYEKPAGGWTFAPNPMNPTAQLQPSNEASHLQLGYSVAIDRVGATIAVGAPCDHAKGVGALCGYVYVWTVPSGHWVDSNHENAVLQHMLANNTIEPTVGFSLAMDWQGGTIVTGAPGVLNPQSPPAGVVTGDVDVFVQTPGTWQTTSTPSAVLAAINTSVGDQVGWSVVVSTDGTTVVAGAPQHPADCSQLPCSPGPGAAYVFTNTNGWLQATELDDIQGQSGDWIGTSVALSDGGTVLVGAPFGNGAYGRIAAFLWNYRGLAQQQPFQWPSPNSGQDQSGNVVFNVSGWGAHISITRPLHIGSSFGQFTNITAVSGDVGEVNGVVGVPVTLILIPQ